MKPVVKPMKTKTRQTYVLVYQAGIANLFFVKHDELSDIRLAAGRKLTERELQGDFRLCENVFRGLQIARAKFRGYPYALRAASCNRAGDIANVDWTTTRDDSPFSEKFRDFGLNWLKTP